MSNRGTGPDWDDEEIQKWGFFGHMENVARGNRRWDSVFKKQRKEGLLKLLAFLRKLLTAKELNVDIRELEWIDGVLHWVIPKQKHHSTGEVLGSVKIPVADVPRLPIHPV